MLKTPWQHLAGAIALILALGVASGPAVASSTFWAEAAKPGRFILMRHAEAPGVGDPPGFSLSDCKTQRNLDERGRAQSRKIAEAARVAGVSFRRVLSSPWCRCAETARLVAGMEPEIWSSLASFFEEPEKAKTQIAALRRDLAKLPSDGPAILVTHQVVISGLLGLNPASGEMVVVERATDGRLQVRERLLIR